MGRCYFSKLTLLFLIFLTFTMTVFAEDTKIQNMTIDELKKALNISVYLQGGYTYNFKNPDSQENELRTFDHKANSFGLDLAQLLFAKDPSISGIGYRFKLSAGETAKLIHSRGLGSATDAFDITEGYISYMAPLGKGLRFDFGKWVTCHGSELIEAKDNPNYSRSLLFNYAIPFTHTGLKIGYPFSDTFNTTFYLVNGWDNTDDNNKGKTVGITLSCSPLDQFSSALNLMYGPEKDNNTSDNRFLLDWVGTIKPMKNLSFILNADYATEEKSASNSSEAKWSGVTGVAKYDFNDLFSLSLRGEYFYDRDGLRTGTKQTLKEVTISPEFRLVNGLIVRPEYRHDWSDAQSFDSGNRKEQDTIAIGFMYIW